MSSARPGLARVDPVAQQDERAPRIAASLALGSVVSGLAQQLFGGFRRQAFVVEHDLDARETCSQALRERAHVQGAAACLRRRAHKYVGPSLSSRVTIFFTSCARSFFATSSALPARTTIKSSTPSSAISSPRLPYAMHPFASSSSSVAPPAMQFCAASS